MTNGLKLDGAKGNSPLAERLRDGRQRRAGAAEHGNAVFLAARAGLNSASKMTLDELDQFADLRGGRLVARIRGILTVLLGIRISVAREGELRNEFRVQLHAGAG